MQVSYKYDSSSSNSRSPLEVWTEHGIQVLNRVFVRGIPSKMTELQLEILFGGMGYVQNVRIVEDIRTGANKGYGFVTFRTAEEARKVQEMDRPLRKPLLGDWRAPLKMGLVQWNDKVLQVDIAVKRKAKSRIFNQQYAMPQHTPVYVMVQPDAGLPIPMEGNVRCQELNQMLPLENWTQSYA